MRAKLMPYAIACLIFIVAMSVVFAKVGPPQKGTGPGKGQPPVASVGLDQGTKEKPQSLHPPAPAGHHRITLSKRVTFFRDGNLRKGPSRHASVLTWARKGTVFVKLGEKKRGCGKWYKVSMPHGGIAWVSSAVAKAKTGVS